MYLVPQPQVGVSVGLHVIGRDIYEVSYPLPPHEAPWEFARVVGHTPYLDELIPMIEAAWERVAIHYAH